jgi:PAS domain S-box-containing protein
MPAGHAAVARELTVPVMRAGRVCAVLGVGNKPPPYEGQDVDDDSALADLAWDIAARKRAEEELARSEARYRGLFTTMMDGLVVVDMAGVIQDFNETYREMLGHSAEELSRRTYEELTPERWHPVEARIVAEQILPRGFSDVYEKEYRRKDGSIFPVELRTFLLREEGQPSAMWAIVRDISARKGAEGVLRAALRTLESHAANSPLAVIEWGPDFRIARWNPRAEEVFGWSASEVLGKRMDDMPWVPEEEWPSVRAVSRAMEKGAKASNVNANRNRRKEGAIIHCEWHNSSIYDENG